MLKKRKISRDSDKKTEITKSETIDQSMMKKKKVTSSSARQVNIQAFFKPSTKKCKKVQTSNATAEEGNDFKRKAVEVPNDVSPEKKNKSSTM